jgi:hypothetical protein
MIVEQSKMPRARISTPRGIFQHQKCLWSISISATESCDDQCAMLTGYLQPILSKKVPKNLYQHRTFELLNSNLLSRNLSKVLKKLW